MLCPYQLVRGVRVFYMSEKRACLRIRYRRFMGARLQKRNIPLCRYKKVPFVRGSIHRMCVYNWPDLAHSPCA